MDGSTMTTEAPAGPTRRRLLKCMTYAGAGLLWSVSGGVPKAMRLGAGEALAATGDFTFMQISDSHIGFKNAPNPDPAATLHEAVARIGALPTPPALLLHTGDVSHLSKPVEFDTAAQIISAARLDTHYVPGEHDTLSDDGKGFFERFGKGAAAGGWYSFDQGGVHFVGLVNVLNLRPGGLGYLGPAQLDWLERDLQGRGPSTPLVVFAHMPLWPLYPQWGWGTDDAARALAATRRFGSVTILNGHVHQVLQKVEGNLSFQTARSTAYPQPAPGNGPGPGPLKVPAERLRSVLGIRRVEIMPGTETTRIIDTALDA